MRATTTIGRCAGPGSVALGLALLVGPVRANDHGNGGAVDPRIVPTSATIEGRTYHEWAAAWWQWALSFPPDDNPILDTTGAAAGQGQSGSVYLLAGTFGTTAVRTVSVPQGVFLFFPLFASEWDTVPGFPNVLNLPDPLSVNDIRRIAAAPVGETAVACTIDGVRVPNLARYRARSPVFSMNMDPGMADLNGYESTYVRTAVADGYYLMVKPLPPGRHRIRFTARNPKANFALDVTYNLTIVPPTPTAR